jgi:surface antigen
MTFRPTDETLSAYVDGELSPEQVAELEARLAGDAELAAEIDTLRQGAAALHAAFNEPLREPVPDHLARIFAAPPAAAKRSFGWAGFGSGFAVPIAASLLMLAVSLGGAYAISEWQVERKIARLEAVRAADRQMLATAVTKALETHVSGKPAAWNNPETGSYGTIEPVRTFRAASGQWCREYVETADLVTESVPSERRRGIACRDPDGQWRPRLELLQTSF